MNTYRTGYKTELKPNNKQNTLLLKHAGTARYAYNWALERTSKKELKPNAMEIHKYWTKWKKENISWWSEVSKCAPQESFRDLENAYKHFFRKLKLSKRGKFRGKLGYPKFKSKKNSIPHFSLTGAIYVEHNRAKLPRIGWIKLKEENYLPIGKPSQVFITQKAGRWFVSIQKELPLKKVKKEYSSVGVDLGVKTLAYCSDKKVFENNKFLKKALKKLKRIQKKHSRRTKGGKNREKMREILAKQHFKVANQRKNSLHEITSYLTRTKSRVVIEDLNVSGMLKNRKLARSIADCGFYEFRRQLEYKGLRYGCIIVIANRWFPSSKTCSHCGWYNKDLKLKDRIFRCKECGLKIDRDLNAAINLNNYTGTVSSTESSEKVSSEKAFGERSSGYSNKNNETALDELGIKQKTNNKFL